MKVQELLDQIEQDLQDPLTRRIPHDRWRLLDWLSQELDAIVSLEEWDTFVRYLLPAIKTEIGRRTYLLPEDFPDNFVRTTDVDTAAYLCKLDDGTNEVLLGYEAPVTFLARNLRAEANGRPSTYTVVTVSDGHKELWLSPPPDATSYAVGGAYNATNWTIGEQDDLPLIPGPLLRYAVLRRVAPDRGDWQAEYQRHLGAMYTRAARSRQAAFAPGQLRQYDLMRTR